MESFPFLALLQYRQSITKQQEQFIAIFHVYFHMMGKGEDNSLQQTLRIQVLRKSLMIRQQCVLQRQLQTVQQHTAIQAFIHTERKFRSHSGIKHIFTSLLPLHDSMRLFQIYGVQNNHCNFSVLSVHIVTQAFIFIKKMGEMEVEPLHLALTLSFFISMNF